MPTAPTYPGVNGFLPFRGTFMIDLVFVAMFLAVPVLAWSIYQVRYRRRYTLHKWTNITLGVILLVAVVAFEIDIRFVSGWTERARPSPYFATWVYPALYTHLVFSISTGPLWIFTIVQALRFMPNPPGPCAYSGRHKFWAWLAAADLTLTAITGWIFYWLAFAAT